VAHSVQGHCFLIFCQEGRADSVSAVVSGNVESDGVAQWRVLFAQYEANNFFAVERDHAIRRGQRQKVVQRYSRVRDARRKAGLVEAMEGAEIVLFVSSEGQCHKSTRTGNEIGKMRGSVLGVIVTRWPQNCWLTIPASPDFS
jgi:hypothetical protein